MQFFRVLSLIIYTIWSIDLKSYFSLKIHLLPTKSDSYKVYFLNICSFRRWDPCLDKYTLVVQTEVVEEDRAPCWMVVIICLFDNQYKMNIPVHKKLTYSGTQVLNSLLLALDGNMHCWEHLKLFNPTVLGYVFLMAKTREGETAMWEDLRSWTWSLETTLKILILWGYFCLWVFTATRWIRSWNRAKHLL